MYHRAIVAPYHTGNRISRSAFTFFRFCQAHFSSTVTSETTLTSPDSLKCIFTGLPKFATREFDLQRYLGNIVPKSIDAILDKHYIPTGRWMLELQSVEDIHLLKNRIDSMDKKYKNLFLMFGSKLDAFKEKNLLVLASQVGITSATVRLRDIPASCKEHHIIYLFENYSMIPTDPIVKIETESKNINNPKVNYLVHFSSPMEAHRCVIDKLHTPVEGFRLNLFKYDI